MKITIFDTHKLERPPCAEAQFPLSTILDLFRTTTHRRNCKTCGRISGHLRMTSLILSKFEFLIF